MNPWDDEPDELTWVDEETGYTCCILRCGGTWRRSNLGHLCGYVRVPRYHPMCGKGDDGFDVDVHGGLTFGAATLQKGLPVGGWWYGFDCGHAGDLVPGLPVIGDQVYRNIAYVRAECTRLARQLRDMVPALVEMVGADDADPECD